MTSAFWTEFFLKYDRVMEEQDMTWDEQKQWMRTYLNKRCKLKSGDDLTDAARDELFKVSDTGHLDMIEPMLVCSRCWARFGVGTIHQCPKEVK